jgi:hypothetical protein
MMKIKNRFNATRFDFQLHVHTLQPWPAGNKAIGAAPGRGRRGAGGGATAGWSRAGSGGTAARARAAAVASCHTQRGGRPSHQGA